MSAVAGSAQEVSRRSDRKLDIVHVYKDYHPVVGGIENHLKLVAEAQAAEGHRVSVLVSAEGRKGETSTENGVEIVRSARIAAPASTPLSPGLFLKVMRRKPDIVHLHSPYPPGELAWLLRGRHPAVMTYHSDVVKQRVLGQLWAPLQRKVLSKIDRVFATSPRYVESSPFLRHLPNSKLRVLPLGIDLQRYVEAGDRFRASKKRGRDSGSADLRIVFVGRLRYYKGLSVLVEALPDLPEGIRLTVVGTGPLGDELRSRARSLGVSERIDWLGDGHGLALHLDGARHRNVLGESGRRHGSRGATR
jgi:glycosyltransferase involved in cell wall biosynthesis